MVSDKVWVGQLDFEKNDEYTIKMFKFVYSIVHKVHKV